MKMAVVATIVCAGGIIYGALTIIQRTPYWWASIILGIALFFALYVGVRLREREAQERDRAKENESTKDK